MAGVHPKGTNDADGDGKKGGSLPEKRPLEERFAMLLDICRANGWSLPKGLE